MAVTAQKIPIKRIRDLLALTRSPNPHEAARARERADELLERYGLSEDDLVEKATERWDAERLPTEGEQRRELARVIAYSRGVTLEADEVAFTGLAEAAKDARQLFSALCRIVEGQCELPSSAGKEGERYLWRLCFWLGFVDGIQRQLDPEHAHLPAAALAAIVQSGAPAPHALTKAVDAYREMEASLAMSFGPDAAHEAAENFRAAAHELGLQLALSIPVPAYRGKR